ncbi:unnamed protein product [Triticum turgidum subsp. durum]|uniref:Uncharacterized protein n=1 Tax=Triticum turgidum subsp. durum TaxID=4567 RepID=A0A9R0RVY7_TRITD|nr:unnamed protein product [Triticum turgidum subsp. durum]
MGRGKIEIKRIENQSNRQVTFSKRKNGILKKAKEISVLCDAEVGVVVFSSAGKLYDFCSPKTSLSRILEKYQTNSGKILWDEKHKSLSAEIDRIKKENDNMQIELRHLKGEDLNSLQPKELIMIEEALDNGLTSLHEKQMEHYDRLMKHVWPSFAYMITCSAYFVDHNAVLSHFALIHCFIGQLQGKMLEDENKLLAFKVCFSQIFA